jgi:putative methyltransferase (TIGR04325 family)
MSWKKIAASLAPPVLTSIYRNARASRAFHGRFRSWKEAREMATGYDSPVILEKVLSSVKEQRDGGANFTRDGIVLENARLPYHILAMIFRQGAIDGGQVRVLDFGGSLGNVYFQCRPLLAGIKDLKWNVVEQRNHVELGNREFGDSRLRFHESLDTLDSAPNVLLLSSVLQYLEDPYAQLEKLLALRPATVVIDRTPIALSGEEFLTVQKVPPSIYPASYPSWVFSKQRLLAAMSRSYELAGEILNADNLDPSAEYRGFIFLKR